MKTRLLIAALVLVAGCQAPTTINHARQTQTQNTFDSDLETVGYLRALSETIKAKIDIYLDVVAEAGNESLVKLIAANEKGLQRSRVLMDSLGRHPVPPSCTALSQQFAEFVNDENEETQRQIDFFKATLYSPKTARNLEKDYPARTREYDANRTKMVSEINAEIRRVSTSTPGITSRVVPFKILD